MVTAISPKTAIVCCLSVTGVALCGASSAQARVTQVVIKATESPTFGGKSFGAVGQYERISGQIVGEVDPNDPVNDQGDPLPANAQQVVVIPRHHFVAELIDFFCRHSGLAQSLGDMVDDAKVIGGHIDFHGDLGMSGRHRRSLPRASSMAPAVPISAWVIQVSAIVEISVVRAPRTTMHRYGKRAVKALHGHP
jgi:hypothetical protein